MRYAWLQYNRWPHFGYSNRTPLGCPIVIDSDRAISRHYCDTALGSHIVQDEGDRFARLRIPMESSAHASCATTPTLA
jgi:hypothetical protein